MKMHRIFTGLMAICLLSFAPVIGQGMGGGLNLQTQSEDEAEGPIIVFEETEYQLGQFQQGETVSFEYKFSNAGSEELVVEHVKPSCSCSKLEWTETALQPGESGEIQVAIDTKDKMGEQTKYFTVIYNGNPGVERLKVYFQIDAPEGDVEEEEHIQTGQGLN